MTHVLSLIKEYMRYLLLLLIMAYGYSVEVPEYVMKGILKVETRSSYLPDGKIKYVDKRRGLAGERGCFQMTEIAFDQIKKRGEQFWMIESDRYFAEECAKRYLIWLYTKTANQDWILTIQQYNAGPYKKSPVYLEKFLLACK
jgi:hypothetical protein